MLISAAGCGGGGGSGSATPPPANTGTGTAPTITQPPTDTSTGVVVDGPPATGATTGTTPSAIPGTPVISTASVNETSISVTWQADASTTHYVITRNGTVISSPVVATTTYTNPPQSSSFVDTGLSFGKSYSYQIQACNVIGCSPVSATSTSTPMSAALLAAVTANDSNFYTQSTLLANLPAQLPASLPASYAPLLPASFVTSSGPINLPATPSATDSASIIATYKAATAAFAAIPYNSFKGVTSKGNDALSTKRLDIVNFYNNIRNGDATVYKEYTGTVPVYAEIPSWVEGSYDMGILNLGWQQNALDFYNFTRALFGDQWVYMSGYKEVATQVAAMSNLNGSHRPNVNDANAAGMGGAMFEAISWARAGSCLMGGAVNTKANYGTYTTFPANAKLSSIWSEAESGRIAELGHRAAFLNPGQRDVGIGAVNGYYVWEPYGGSPQHNNGNLLGAEQQQTLYNYWPVGPVPAGTSAWPSHGYFPFFMLHGNNQGWAVDILGGVASLPAKGEVITLKLEYFVHAADGDLSTLNQSNAISYQTITLTDTVGVANSGFGPVNPATGVPDYSNAEQIPGGGTGAQFVQGGGYYFTTSGSSFKTQWRMPQNWYDDMKNDFSSTTGTPNYHTVRATFTSNGPGFKVIKPFYMNQTVGAPLVVQTTFFDIQRQTQ